MGRVVRLDGFFSWLQVAVCSPADQRRLRGLGAFVSRESSSALPPLAHTIRLIALLSRVIIPRDIPQAGLQPPAAQDPAGRTRRPASSSCLRLGVWVAWLAAGGGLSTHSLWMS